MRTFVLLGLFLLLVVPVEAALFGNYCWALTNGTSCINGSTGTNTLQDVDVPYSLITGHPAASGYDLNVSGDSGSGLIEDDEVFSLVGSGTVSTSFSGNELTITGSAHTSDTNANTICAGSQSYLDGEGNCDVLSALTNFSDDLAHVEESTVNGTGLNLTGFSLSIITSLYDNWNDAFGWGDHSLVGYSVGVHSNLSESDVEGYVFDADNSGSLFTSGYLNSSDLVNASVDVCITGGTCLSAALTSYTETDPLWSANESRVTTNEQDIANLETSNTSVNARVDALETSNTSVNTRVDNLETSNTTTNTRIDTKVEVDTCGPGNSTHVEVVQNTTASGSACVNVSRNPGGGASAFDLNVTTDGGSEIVILDGEDLNFVSAGTVTVTSSGNDVTVSGSAHTVDTNETTRVDELEANVSQVNTTANIESLGFTQGPHTVATNLSESDVEGYIFDPDNSGSLFTSGYLNSSDTVNASVDVCITGGTCLSAALTSYTETDPLWSANESRVTTNEQDIASMENLSTSDVAGIAPNITLSGGLDVLTLSGQDLTYSIGNLVSSIGNFSGENGTIVRAGYDDANCTSTDQVTDVGLTINSSGAFITTQCTAQGSGGGMSGFDVTNGSVTETITDGETVTIAAGRNVTINQTTNSLTINAVDTQLSEATVESYIFDDDNTGSMTTTGTLTFDAWAEGNTGLNLSEVTDDLTLTANVTGSNVFTLATTGTFLELVANPGAGNDYVMFSVAETQGAQTYLNFYEGGTGHNRFWDSGSARFGGSAGSLCDAFGGLNFPDCDTSGTGADVVIEDDLWVGGDLVLGNGTVNTTDAGKINVTVDVCISGGGNCLSVEHTNVTNSDVAGWGFLTDVLNDTSPQLGGNLDLNQFNLDVDPTPDSDHSWSGLTASHTAGEALVIGDLVYLNSDGKFWKMDADAASTTRGTAALSTATIGADSTGTFLMRGYIRDDSWSWTVAQDLYASVTPGNPTGTAPSATGDIVRIVGQAYSATVVYFNPDNTYIELS